MVLFFVLMQGIPVVWQLLQEKPCRYPQIINPHFQEKNRELLRQVSQLMVKGVLTAI
jgi:hypothetical protein